MLGMFGYLGKLTDGVLSSSLVKKNANGPETALSENLAEEISHPRMLECLR